MTPRPSEPLTASAAPRGRRCIIVSGPRLARLTVGEGVVSCRVVSLLNCIVAIVVFSLAWIHKHS